VVLTSRFDTALLFASELHRKQIRKGTEIPYISHLLAVTALVIENSGTENEAIAALLHDAIEDQGDTYPGGRHALRQHITKEFGSNVMAIVDSCTDDEGHRKYAGGSFQQSASNGWSESSSTSKAFPTNHLKHSGSPVPTSSTTPSQSLPITPKSGLTSGIDFGPRAVKIRFTITEHLHLHS
jgi:hypothetical protein